MVYNVYCYKVGFVIGQSLGFYSFPVPTVLGLKRTLSVSQSLLLPPRRLPPHFIDDTAVVRCRLACMWVQSIVFLAPLSPNSCQQSQELCLVFMHS